MAGKKNQPQPETAKAAASGADNPDLQQTDSLAGSAQGKPDLPDLDDLQPPQDAFGEETDLQADQELAEQEIGSADQVTEKLLEERDSLKDQLLRALADLENLRRRSERDLQAARKYGHVSFARDLLASIDNLGQAVAAAPQERDGLDEGLVNLLVGLEMVVREIDSVLEKHQIRPINPLGEKFDYNVHQAMFEIATDEAPPGTVLQVAQPGYMLDDRLLRPAMVGVAKAAEGEK